MWPRAFLAYGRRSKSHHAGHSQEPCGGGKLTKERRVTARVPTRLTDAEKADSTRYEPRDLIQFHQNAKGYTKGSQLIVGEDGGQRRPAGTAVSCARGRRGAADRTDWPPSRVARRAAKACRTRARGGSAKTVEVPR